MGMLRLDWNFAATIVNLIVLYLLLRRFLFGPIQNLIDQRKELIDSKFSQAKDVQTSAEQMKENYENLLKTAKDESREIVEKARVQAKAEYDEKMEQAEHETSMMLEHAREKIDMERERMLHELEMQISSLALCAAGKVIGRMAGQKYDDVMYDKFLKEAGDGNDTNRN